VAVLAVLVRHRLSLAARQLRVQSPRRAVQLRSPVHRQRLVGVGAVAGYLAADPLRGLPGAALLGGGKLDLGHEQAGELALVAVDLRRQAAAERDEEAGLAQGAALGERPERLELVGGELD